VTRYSWVDDVRDKVTGQRPNDDCYRLARKVLELKRRYDAAIAALHRVVDSPFEPDKWRLEVENAIAKSEKPLWTPQRNEARNDNY